MLFGPLGYHSSNLFVHAFGRMLGDDSSCVASQTAERALQKLSVQSRILGRLRFAVRV